MLNTLLPASPVRGVFTMSPVSSKAALVGLFVLLVTPELVLTGADVGVWGAPDWRPEAYRHGAFWVGLTGDWLPAYPLQAWIMFLTHGFLHGGAAHLIFNLATLAAIGAPILRDLGAARFLALYGFSMLGGGLAFAVLGPVQQPMVGASGALFGLVGALIGWSVVDAWRAGDGAGAAGRAFVLPTAALIALDLAMYVVTGGHLAWQAHLGGFVAGFVAAPLLELRPARTASVA